MVKLGTLGTITRGTAGSSEEYEPGVIPLITASTENLGLYGYVTPAAQDKVLTAGSITVAANGEGSIMYAAVQMKDFICSINTVAISLPELSLTEKVALCAIIRNSRWRYSYGRILSHGRLASLEIDLDLVRRVAAALQIYNDTQASSSPPLPPSIHPAMLRPGGVTIGEVFDEIKGYSSIDLDMLKDTGEVAVVTASEKNNGVSGYLDAQDLPAGVVVQQGPLISVAKNGRPGIARVQVGTVVCNGDVLLLKPNGEFADISIFELLSVAAVIEHQSWRFGYGRKITWGRFKDLPLAVVGEQTKMLAGENPEDDGYWGFFDGFEGQPAMVTLSP